MLTTKLLHMCGTLFNQIARPRTYRNARAKWLSRVVPTLAYFVFSSGLLAPICGSDSSALLADTIRLSSKESSKAQEIRRIPNYQGALFLSAIETAPGGNEHFVPLAVSIGQADVAVTRARRFQISPELLQGKNALSEGAGVLLDLFADATYPSVIHAVTTNRNGTTSLTLKLSDFEFAYGFVSITGNTYLVSIEIPERAERYESRRHPVSGEIYLVQLDPLHTDILELTCDAGHPHGSDHDHSELAIPKTIQRSVPPQGTEPAPGVRNEKNAEHSDGATEAKDNLKRMRSGGQMEFGVPASVDVDLMLIYTPAARNWANASGGGIANVIGNAMARANLVSSNANLGIAFNLVYSELVNYTEAGSSNDLNRLQNPSDGYLDGIHAIRDETGADIVQILTQTNDTGGLGYLLDDLNGYPSYAFSLTRVQQAANTFTVVHEVGHNMGAMHSKAQSVQPGPTYWENWPENRWSAGWRFQGNNSQYYTTVMAYESGSYYPDGNHASRIPYFSDPTLTYQGQPIGHPVDADNASTLRVSRNIVADYRKAPSVPNQVADTFAYYPNWTGAGDSRDTLKSLAQEVSEPTTLNIGNMINCQHGIGGIGLEFSSMPGQLTTSDFLFQISPQGAFSELSAPPADWQPAPAPNSVNVVGGPSNQVRIEWASGSIANRWLRITVLATENTQLSQPQVFYLGHLLGETTGASGDVFAVSFSDIVPIRSEAGQSVGAGSTLDINKDGVVAFGDINAMRSAVGSQLPAITIPASGND